MLEKRAALQREPARIVIIDHLLKHGGYNRRSDETLSLLASRSFLPASAALNVEEIPAAPTIAPITISTSGLDAISSIALAPAKACALLPAALSSSCRAPRSSLSAITATLAPLSLAA